MRDVKAAGEPPTLTGHTGTGTLGLMPGLAVTLATQCSHLCVRRLPHGGSKATAMTALRTCFGVCVCDSVKK